MGSQRGHLYEEPESETTAGLGSDPALPQAAGDAADPRRDRRDDLDQEPGMWNSGRIPWATILA